MNTRHDSGGLERKYQSYKTAVSEEELLAYLKINPDAYQSEIGERFGRHQSVICRTLKRFNITRKKNMKLYKEQDAKKVAEYLEPVQDLTFSGFFCDDFSPSANAAHSIVKAN
ncbi:MAG: transposase [Clostridiales bacterium]|nr:transposase [Clostridiales bacterium]